MGGWDGFTSTSRGFSVYVDERQDPNRFLWSKDAESYAVAGASVAFCILLIIWVVRTLCKLTRDFSKRKKCFVFSTRWCVWARADAEVIAARKLKNTRRVER